jgi:hypothetical protein
LNLANKSKFSRQFVLSNDSLQAIAIRSKLRLVSELQLT